jgi:mono/diheme cytochrome c family protein
MNGVVSVFNFQRCEHVTEAGERSMKRFVVIFVLVGVGLWVAYSVFIYYDNNFRFGRMRETLVVKPHEAPIPTMDQDAVPIHGGEAVLRVSDGEGLSSPLQSNAPETLAVGKKAYLNYCMPCHGKNLDGLGTVGQSFYPLPTNLKDPSVVNQEDGDLFYTISYGKARSPALATTMSVNDRWAVIHYVRSWTPDVKEAK